jgi:PadR family transcriptional regulator PadR
MRDRQLPTAPPPRPAGRRRAAPPCGSPYVHPRRAPRLRPGAGPLGPASTSPLAARKMQGPPRTSRSPPRRPASGRCRLPRGSAARRGERPSRGRFSVAIRPPEAVHVFDHCWSVADSLAVQRVVSETHGRVTTMPPRMTLQTQAVLAQMLQGPTEEHYGLELAKAASLSSGTIYPILARLEAAGWITSAWEDIDEAKAGRRARRYYRLTGEGERAARAVLHSTSERLDFKAGRQARREGLSTS